MPQVVGAWSACLMSSNGVLLAWLYLNCVSFMPTLVGGLNGSWACSIVSCNMIVSRTHAFISVLSGWHGWVSQQQIQVLCGHFLPDLREEMSAAEAGIQCVWLVSHCLFIVRLFCSQVGDLENCCYHIAWLPHCEMFLLRSRWKSGICCSLCQQNYSRAGNSGRPGGKSKFSSWNKSSTNCWF